MFNIKTASGEVIGRAVGLSAAMEVARMCAADYDIEVFLESVEG